MITKYELCEIAGYPEIVSHIVDISSVVTIRLKNEPCYGFTIVLDSYECINVSKACENNNKAMEIFQAMSNLRRNLESMVIINNPMYNSKPMTHQEDKSLLEKP